MTPGEAAKAAGISVAMIRYYANRRELACTRNRRGERVFDDGDVARLRKAIRMIRYRKHLCPFCATKIPQRRRYCDSPACCRRRIRIRQKRWYHLHAARKRSATQESIPPRSSEGVGERDGL